MVVTMKTLAAAIALTLIAACAGLEPHPGITQGTATLSRIESGKSTRDDVRRLLGAPIQTSSLPRQNREVWEYRMRDNGTSGQMMFVWVQFSPDGLAREVLQVSESSYMGSFTGQSD
jgi:outer membrane protein assembly factor BamE (lipoprotein component of BamABCDE complex)